MTVSENAGSSVDPRLAEAIVETIREPLLVLNADLSVRIANPAFYEVFHTSPENTVGVSLYSLGSGHWDIPALRRLLEEVVPEDRVVEDFEVRHEFPDIGYRVMAVNARQIALPDGAGAAILLAIEDVTERHRSRRELERHARALERSNRELEEFAYVASHDLQEPLRMVASYLTLLERRYRNELDDDAREFIDYAVDGARRMKQLIDSLLDYSRVGRQELKLETVAGEELAEAALDGLQIQLEEAGAEVEVDELPEVRVDPGLVSRVFQNLVSNAVRFRREDEPLRIAIAAEPEDGRWRFAVRDNGRGIPPDQHDRIFRLFEQLESRHESQGGTGMGLSISQRIVEQHGGRMWLESEPGRGSTFYFTLPTPDGELPREGALP